MRIVAILLILANLPVLMVEGQEGHDSEQLATVDSLKEALQSPNLPDSSRVNLLNELGFAHWIIDPNAAAVYGNEALDLASAINFYTGMAFAKRVLGVSHWVRNNYFFAFKFLFEAHDEYSSLQDSLGIANTLLNLGMVYQDQHDEEQAIAEYEQALSIFKNLNRSDRVATTLTKWGSLLIDLRQYDEAYDMLTKALATHTHDEFTYGIAEVNNQLGELFIRKEEYATAISHLLLSVEAGAERYDHVGIADNFQKLGAIYLKQNNLASAEEYLTRSERMANAFQLKEILRDVYQGLIDLYQEKGQIDQAFAYSIKHAAMLDTIYSEREQRKVTSLTSQYEFLQKEQDLQLAQREIDLLTQQRRASNLLKVILGLLVMLAAFLAYYFTERQRKKTASKEIQLEKVQLQSKELKSTIQDREKELTSFTLNFAQKNKLLQDLKEKIRIIKTNALATQRKELSGLERMIESAVRIDDDWADFKVYFESTHWHLIQGLKYNYPKLTGNDLRLLALIRLQLSTKDIAPMLGISPESVKTARYRLRKKLNLGSSLSLFDHLLAVENENSSNQYSAEDER